MSPKTVFTTKKRNIQVNKDDPLPTTQSSGHGQNTNIVTQSPRNVTGVAPIYGFEPKTTIVGLQLEVFMGIIIGSLVVSIIVIGIIYNCVRRKEGEKDLELDSSIGYDEDDDEEDEKDLELDSSIGYDEDDDE